MDAIEVGLYIGVVKVLKGDPDPDATMKLQRQRIYMMVYRNTIPFIRQGKRLMFDKHAIDEWMRTGMQPTRSVGDGGDGGGAASRTGEEPWTLTIREIEAMLAALSRVLAGGPETEDEDIEGMKLARQTLSAILKQKEA